MYAPVQSPHVVMPDKTRYRRVESEEIAAIVDAHFPKAQPDPQPRPFAVPALAEPIYRPTAALTRAS
jgi:(2Fe-2S) ferredoxin